MNTILLEIIAALGLAVATGLYGAHVGEKAGANRVQVAWDADKAAIVAEAIRARAKDTADLLAAHARNEELTNANSSLQAAVSASAAAGADMANRLHNALSAPARSCPVQQAGNQPAATAPAGESAAASITDALAAYDGACQRDAAKLTALQGEIAPQL